MSDRKPCPETIDTVPCGLVQCQHLDGKGHGPDHYYDHVKDGRFSNRIDWSDDRSGYGSTPAVRLGFRRDRFGSQPKI